MVGKPLRECTKCKQLKDVSEYHKKKGSRDGFSRTCKSCDYKVILKSREKNPDTHTNYWLKSKYGITLDEFNNLLNKQDGRCAICKTIPDYRLCVDHRHDTGKVRGLLCKPCNKAIGQLGDTPESVKIAYEYLVRTH